MDTNCDPDDVDYVIPANDDALRSIRLFVTRIADAVIAGRRDQEASPAASDRDGDSGTSVASGSRPVPAPAQPAPA